MAAVQAHDWGAGLLVAVAGVLIFFVSSRAWLGHPERKGPVGRFTLAPLCAVTLLVVNLRWQRWGAGSWARDFGPLSSSRLGANIGLVFLYAILGFCLCWNRKPRWQRNQP